MDGSNGDSTLSRRSFFGLIGAGAGLAVGGPSAGVARWLFDEPYAELDYATCLQRLDDSLSPTQRAMAVHPWDHPSRQIANTITIFQGPHIGTLFNADQIALVRRLYATMLSDQGRASLNNTVTLEGKLEGCTLAIFSDAPAGRLARDQERTQTHISGGHLMVRHGGTTGSGYAFGGPIAYGQQIGNEQFRLPGNAFAVHNDVANAFYASLTPSQRTRSLAPTAPHELMVQPQGPSGEFTGITVGDVARESRERVREWLDTIFASYPPSDRSDAFRAIENNGGLDALRITFYADRGFYEDGARWGELDPTERERRPLPYFQVWRIEGPGAVVHFKGYPHVHAYINVVHDPARQNVGEVLTTAKAPLREPGVRRLLLATLRETTGEAQAFYPGRVPGRILPGDVTTGLVHALDPFDEQVVIASVRGAEAAPALTRALESNASRIDPQRVYRVATIAYALRRPDLLGTPERVDHHATPLREALTGYLREADLGRFHG